MGETLEELQPSDWGDDAAKWAEAFCKTFPDKMDEGTMLGWFANAIEIACDKRVQAAVQAERERKIDELFENIGWPEINAFQEKLAKGQDIYEDAGGFFIRALKALFGSRERPVVENYQAAAKRLIEESKGR